MFVAVIGLKSEDSQHVVLDGDGVVVVALEYMKQLKILTLVTLELHLRLEVSGALTLLYLTMTLG